MTIQITWFLFGAFVSYAIVAVSKFSSRANKPTFIEKSLLESITISGLILHTIALYKIYEVTGAFPTATIYGLIEVIAWFCAVISISGVVLKYDILKKLTIAATILVILPVCCPVFLKNVAAEKISSTLLIQVHAIFAALSYALMFAAFIVSLVYLRKYSALKKAIITESASSLQRLNNIVKNTLLGATLTMLISIVLGIVATSGTPIDKLMFAKISSGVCVFIVQAYISIKIISRNIKGVALATLTTTLIIISIAALLAVGLRNV